MGRRHLSRVVAQFCGLERRTAWGGRDSIDHGPGGHDDLVNAVAGVIVAAVEPPALGTVDVVGHRHAWLDEWGRPPPRVSDWDDLIGPF